MNPWHCPFLLILQFYLWLHLTMKVMSWIGYSVWPIDLILHKRLLLMCLMVGWLEIISSSTFQNECTVGRMVNPLIEAILTNIIDLEWPVFPVCPGLGEFPAQGFSILKPGWRACWRCWTFSGKTKKVPGRWYHWFTLHNVIQWIQCASLI